MARANNLLYSDQTIAPFHDFASIEHKKIDYDQTVGVENFGDGVYKSHKIDLM